MKDEDKKKAQDLKGKIELDLSRQELFCKLYTSQSEFFGNGVQSYVEAYDIDVSIPGKYASARTMASNLLTNLNILERINALLEEQGLNDQFADKQTLFLMTQNADLTTKRATIDMYNKLKGRYEKDNKQKAPLVNVYKDLSTDELLKIVSE